MEPAHKRQGYAIAIAASIVVLIVRDVIHEPLGEQAVLLPFVLAVIVAAWRGGLGPGLLATALGTLLRLFFLDPPLWPWSPENIDHALSIAIFVPICGTISFLCQALHDARRREVEKTGMLHSVLDTAPDAIVTLDPSGAVVGVNRATERLFGYADAEILGADIALLLPACDDPEDDSAPAARRDLAGIGGEVLAERKDGSTFPAEVAISEVGRSASYTAIIRDVSVRKQLEKEVLEIAGEEDRRIGHELHDNTQQQLTGLGLLAQSLAENLARQSTPETAVASRIAEGIQETTRHVHRLARGLVPVDVDAEGLRAALFELAATIGEQYSIRCQFVADVSAAVPDNFVATHLFRIAQEAVNNAIKHGRATNIELALSATDENVILSVVDNGVGKLEESGYSPGLGMRIMRYRASLIGATIQVRPGPVEGTTVRCTVSKRREYDDRRLPRSEFTTTNGQDSDR